MSMKESRADISIGDPFDGSPLFPVNFFEAEAIQHSWIATTLGSSIIQSKGRGAPQ
jgi:hypothetical protein